MATSTSKLHRSSSLEAAAAAAAAEDEDEDEDEGEEAWEYGWGVSSRDGSRWKSVGVIGSPQQRVFVVVGSCRESLGAIKSHWESLGAVRVNFPTKVPGTVSCPPYDGHGVRWR